jgi:hypothetical protein
MAGKTNAFETDLLELFFQATPIADLADNDATSPATNLYVSLHTGDPGETGTQATSEATYTSYARVAKARTSGGWTVTGNAVTPASEITFPAATGGSETETHFGVGTNPTAGVAGYLMYFGTVTPSIVVSSGVTPRLTVASSISED